MRGGGEAPTVHAIQLEHRIGAKAGQGLFPRHRLQGFLYLLSCSLRAEFLVTLGFLQKSERLFLASVTAVRGSGAGEGRKPTSAGLPLMAGEGVTLSEAFPLISPFLPVGSSSIDGKSETARTAPLACWPKPCPILRGD